VTLANKGGLVMPVPLRVHYADNTSETMKLPAEIWRYNSDQVKKLILTEKEIVRLEIDPQREIADTETSNNHWPPRIEPSRFKLFKQETKKNPMQKAGLGTPSETKDGDEKDSDTNDSDDDKEENAESDE
jgi:L-lysine 2,3-aminomutase